MNEDQETSDDEDIQVVEEGDEEDDALSERSVNVSMPHG